MTAQPTIAEMTSNTEKKYKPHADPANKPDTVVEDTPKTGLQTLKDHFTARKAAMKLAYKILSPLDDEARGMVMQCLQDGSEANIESNMVTFKNRLARLLGVSLADAATVK